ncbi:MAG: acyl-CoA thioesterase [Planctomycetales bacterium]|nr:acyl-CoA thioesterase [Planctomycetales bacterium]
MPYTTERRVQFRDTDAGGIMHFASYFGWMEEAEHEALRSIGLSAMDDNFGIGWPRVSAQCDYLGPIRFEDVVTIEVAVDRIGGKSVTYKITIRESDRDVAIGKVTAACCQIGEGGKIVAVPIPDEIRRRLETL